MALGGGTFPDPGNPVADQQFRRRAADDPERAVQRGALLPLPSQHAGAGHQGAVAQRGPEFLVEEIHVWLGRSIASEERTDDAMECAAQRDRPAADGGRLARFLVGQPQQACCRRLIDDPGERAPIDQVDIAGGNTILRGWAV